MADPMKKEAVLAHLVSLGYSQEDAQRWLRGPNREKAGGPKPATAPRPERAVPRGDARLERARDAPRPHWPGHPRPQHGPGVRFREVEYWVQALRQPELEREDRARYMRILKAALVAAETPGVTPEDIAYWLHALGDPALSQELRAYYKRTLRKALREYDLTSEGEVHDA